MKNNRYNFLRKIRIKQRLIIAFLVISLVPVTVTGYVTYRQTSASTIEKFETSSVQLAKQSSFAMDMLLQRADKISKDFMNDTEVNQYFDDYGRAGANKGEIQSKLLQKFSNVSRDYSALLAHLVINRKDNSVLFSSSGAMALDYMDQLTLFTEADQSSYWTYARSKLTNANSDYNIVLTSKVSKDYVMMLYFDGQTLADFFKDLDIGEGSEIFMMDENGVVLLSRDTEVIKPNEQFKENLLNEIIQVNQTEIDTSAILNDKDKDLLRQFDLSIDGEKYLAVYSKIEITGWQMVNIIPYSYILSATQETGKIILICMLLSLLVGIGFSLTIASSISSPLSKLVNVMKKARDGNLAVDIRDQGKDEIGEVMKNFDSMVESIRSLTQGVNTSSLLVKDKSELISSSAEISLQSSQQIATTMQEIAKGATSQVTDIGESLSHMTDLSNEITGLVQAIGDVRGHVSATKYLSEAATESIHVLKQKALETNESSERIIHDINSLNTDMDQIMGIVNIILSISEQTNLLSLNAAIEAARAGEAGRGFAVVADEVKKLAEQTKVSSSSINKLIDSIQIKTKKTIETAYQSSNIVKEQMTSVTNVDSAFKDVLATMIEISNGTEAMDGLISSVLVLREKTISNLEGASSVSQQAAATVEEVTATTEEMISEAEILAQMSSELDYLAMDLQKSLESLRVEESSELRHN